MPAEQNPLPRALRVNAWTVRIERSPLCFHKLDWPYTAYFVAITEIKVPPAIELARGKVASQVGGFASQLS